MFCFVPSLNLYENIVCVGSIFVAFAFVGCQFQILLLENVNVSQMNANINEMHSENGAQNTNRAIPYSLLLQQLQNSFRNNSERNNSTEDISFSIASRSFAVTPKVRC